MIDREPSLTIRQSWRGVIELYRSKFLRPSDLRSAQAQPGTLKSETTPNCKYQQHLYRNIGLPVSVFQYGIHQGYPIN